MKDLNINKCKTCFLKYKYKTTLIIIKINQNNDKIMKKVRKVRKSRTELIKQNFLSGKEHKCDNNKKLIPSRRQCLAFSRKCKCYAKFSDQQLRYVLKHIMISNLKSHCEQYAYLRGERKTFLSLLNKNFCHMKHSIN